MGEVTRQANEPVFIEPPDVEDTVEWEMCAPDCEACQFVANLPEDTDW